MNNPLFVGWPPERSAAEEAEHDEAIRIILSIVTEAPRKRAFPCDCIGACRCAVPSMDRQRALEALGWVFHRRNSKGQWVRYKSNTNTRHKRLLAWAEAN